MSLHHDRDAAKRVLIERFVPCCNVSLDPQPNALPATISRSRSRRAVRAVPPPETRRRYARISANSEFMLSYSLVLVGSDMRNAWTLACAFQRACDTSLVFCPTYNLYVQFSFVSTSRHEFEKVIFMRRDISFMSKGLRCVGWLYLPDNLPAGTKVPAVIMADANGAVKEMVEALYAEKFAAAGIAALAFDFRYLGASEGEPRNQIVYSDQHEDLRNAITFVSEQPEIDGDRIGIWGISAGGGHALHVAAFDKRIKAVVGIVPLGLNFDALQPLMGVEGMAGFMGYLLGDRIGRFHGRPSSYLALVSRGDTQALFPNPAAYDYYMTTSAERAPNFRNEVTLESIEKNLEFDPTGAIHLVSPTPMLIISVEGDMAIPAGKMMAAAFERVGEPKKMMTLPCTHTDVFGTDPYFSQAVSEATAWFKKYLMA